MRVSIETSLCTVNYSEYNNSDSAGDAHAENLERMYSKDVRPNDHDHCWIYDEKQVHLESQLDPATQSSISPNVEQFIDDKADIIRGADVRKSFVSFEFIRGKCYRRIQQRSRALDMIRRIEMKLKLTWFLKTSNPLDVSINIQSAGHRDSAFCKFQ